MYKYLNKSSVLKVVDNPESYTMRQLKTLLAPHYGLVLRCHWYTSGWHDIFTDIKVWAELQKIHAALRGINVYPARKQIFRVFIELEPEDIRVIILGQDPYHNGSACGLAFASENMTASLSNILKELRADGFRAQSNDITPWVSQGVFLLNTALTVLPHQAGSHSELWSKFTTRVLKLLEKKIAHAIVILWGAHAKAQLAEIPTLKFDILASAHPSPFSANKGFFGSKPFSKANKYLVARGLPEIDWNT